MTRNAFIASLNELNDALLKMAVLTEKALADAIDALERDDKELAQKIYDNDDVVDDMEKEIETMCINIIATQQPIAGDLRLVTAVMKMITDLERIADHAADISEVILSMKVKRGDFDLTELIRMAHQAKDMVKDSVKAYVSKNIELATEVCDRDETVDQLFFETVASFRTLMSQKPELIEAATDYMFIAKYFERVGDHTTNIAEWAIYNITGKHVHMQ
jgi:phosphate transport system protein